MSGKEKAPQGRAMGPFREGRKDRADQPHTQGKESAKLLKNIGVDAYCHYVAMVLIPDAVDKLTGFPSKIRFSYYVGSDGRLMTRGEKRGSR